MSNDNKLPGQEEAGQTASEARMPISVPNLEKYMKENVQGFTAPVSVKQFNLGWVRSETTSLGRSDVFGLPQTSE
jgi:hypothetical protein